MPNSGFPIPVLDRRYGCLAIHGHRRLIATACSICLYASELGLSSTAEAIVDSGEIRPVRERVSEFMT
jgi:hypothetical protein